MARNVWRAVDDEAEDSEEERGVEDSLQLLGADQPTEQRRRALRPGSRREWHSLLIVWCVAFHAQSWPP